jgi:hypothetical protein
MLAGEPGEHACAVAALAAVERAVEAAIDG